MGYTPLISLENEVAAWKYIGKLVEDKLNAYPNTIEQDNDIIERNELDNDIGTNKLNCVKFRKSEKNVLHLFKDYANLLIKLSEMSLDDAK